ncbi:MAG: T9SS type A sorting domain-containing protein [Ignavibacteriaceae bacterium]|nr:T9SS type A sorting domain-containing protein [Ignavibacteriaceae bacterium]
MLSKLKYWSTIVIECDGGITRLDTSTPELKKSFYLNQNFRNPFNQMTNIAYQIGEPDIVNIKVYDVLGEEVAALVDNYRVAGSYSVRFDSSLFLSGIYFYKLVTFTFTETKKMPLIK